MNTKAVDTYRSLLDSEDESIKFRTATAIIDYTNKLIEGQELKQRIEALESLLKEKEQSLKMG